LRLCLHVLMMNKMLGRMEKIRHILPTNQSPSQDRALVQCL